MDTVLVLGGYGTFGRRIVELLGRQGIATTVAGRDGSKADALVRTLGMDSVQSAQVDVADGLADYDERAPSSVHRQFTGTGLSATSHRMGARMRVMTAGLLIGLLAAPAAAQEPVTLTPAQIGEIFCLSRLGNDTGPITGLLTGELTAAIAQAEAKDAAWAKANPGDKPPLGDGIPWQAWPDYAPSCSVDGTTYMMDEATARIRYSFPDAPDANFTDTLKLRLVEAPGAFGRVWRIDDIAYATEGSLRQVLEAAFLPN